MRIAQSGIILLCLLAGCSVYKEYERPDDISARTVLGPEASSDTTSIADIGWREFFPDTLLRSLVWKGLENNADLAVASERILQAEGNLSVAKWSLVPSLWLKPSFQMENADRYGGNVLGYNISPSFSWEADLRGSLYNARRTAQADADRARLYERTVRTELVAKIAQCYYSLLMLDAQLLVSKTTSDNWKENVRIMKAMKNAGMTNEASVSQTEANACSIEASVFDLEYKIVEAENTLSLLLGENVSGVARESMGNARLGGDQILEGIPAAVLSNRPDVLAAEQDLRKAYYGVCAARSAFYPSLTLSGDFGWEKALTSPAGWALGLAASAAEPIFNAGRNRVALSNAQSRQREALANFRQTILKAGAEVDSAMARCKAARSKAEIRANQIAALEKAVESTQQLMRHSSQSTYLEVLTAQQSLLSAQLLQITDRYDEIQGLIDLYRALGGGSR